MSQNSSAPRLHAGLIERAQPRPAPVTVTIPPASVVPPALPMPQALLWPLVPTFVDLLAERAARLAEPVLRVAHSPEPELWPVRPAATECCGEGASRRRFGLTVRVHDDLRDRLELLCERTGRTKQSVLHEALVARLAAEPRRPPLR